MGKKLCIAVIFGGRSGEHEISLLSARSVISALDPGKYEVVQIGITREGAWLNGKDLLEKLSGGLQDETNFTKVIIIPGKDANEIWKVKPTLPDAVMSLLARVDVVFPVLHGTFGEDGTVQGLLELADIAYIGAGVTGSAVGMDKGIFKDVMRANGIPVVESVVVLRSEVEHKLEEVIEVAEKVSAYPLFVKPANLGSSVGITKCNQRADLVEGLKEAAAYDRRILVERGVNAREIEVSVLGNNQPQASLPGEILPSREFYSYESKYVDGSSNLLIPAPLPAEVTRQIQQLAIRAYTSIDCSGMARVDFFLEKETNQLFLNELNTIPGFTSISMYPKLWEASGTPYPRLIDRLIELALERKAERDHTERQFRRTS